MPAWPASYLVTIAAQTGWSRDFILWELPLSQGWQLQHAILIANGATTVPLLETGIAELQALTNQLSAEVSNGNNLRQDSPR